MSPQGLGDLSTSEEQALTYFESAPNAKAVLDGHCGHHFIAHNPTSTIMLCSSSVM